MAGATGLEPATFGVTGPVIWQGNQQLVRLSEGPSEMKVRLLSERSQGPRLGSGRPGPTSRKESLRKLDVTTRHRIEEAIERVTGAGFTAAEVEKSPKHFHRTT